MNSIQSADAALRDIFQLSSEMGKQVRDRNRARAEYLAEDIKALALSRGELEASGKRMEAATGLLGGAWSIVGGLVTIAGTTTQGVGAGSTALEQASFLESLSLAGSLDEVLEKPVPESVFGEGRKLRELVPVERASEAIERGELPKLGRELLAAARRAAPAEQPVDPGSAALSVGKELAPKVVDMAFDVMSRSAAFLQKDGSDQAKLGGEREEEWSASRGELEAQQDHDVAVERLRRQILSQSARIRVGA